MVCLMRPQDAPRIERSTREQFPQGIPSYGTDALRFTFASLATQGRDIRFDLGRVEGYRNFCNKIWNAARYTLMAAREYDPGRSGEGLEFGLAERWIVSRLQMALQAVREGFETYRFDLAAQAIYDFFWNEFCDWYVEFSKTVLNNDRIGRGAKLGTLRILLGTLEAMLRATHPLMPFLSEEIWQRIAPLTGKSAATISKLPYPEPRPERIDHKALEEFDWVRGFVLGVRRIRAERDLPPGKVLAVRTKGGSQQELAWLDRNCASIQQLARINSIAPAAESDDKAAATALAGEMTVLVPLAELIDRDAEIARLDREIGKLEQDLERCSNKLANTNFVEKAPPQVVAKERARQTDLQSALQRLRERRAQVEALTG